jgi:hypothetical protein
MPASRIIANHVFKSMAEKLHQEITSMPKNSITPTELKNIIGEDNFKRFEANCTKPVEAVLKETEKHQIIIDSFSWYNSIEAIEVGSSDFGFKFWSDVNELYIDKILKR